MFVLSGLTAVFLGSLGALDARSVTSKALAEMLRCPLVLFLAGQLGLFAQNSSDELHDFTTPTGRSGVFSR